ncbi:hypothetical protein NDU88_002677 [Pleurodeles waltl]|uniref:Uncharacterized protein n=1 Tax=Pleurodeles waltl TaxID=8319 RepID=A0AAV7LD07_PLEWA|nr:hypothetical protein NDU88_002677 [Pleurodeles waltl]
MRGHPRTLLVLRFRLVTGATGTWGHQQAAPGTPPAALPVRRLARLDSLAESNLLLISGTQVKPRLFPFNVGVTLVYYCRFLHRISLLNALNRAPIGSPSIGVSTIQGRILLQRGCPPPPLVRCLSRGLPAPPRLPHLHGAWERARTIRQHSRELIPAAVRSAAWRRPPAGHRAPPLLGGPGAAQLPSLIVRRTPPGAPSLPESTGPPRPPHLHAPRSGTAQFANTRGN